MKNNKKNLIIYSPTIEDGGVEKNLYNISNYLSEKIQNITVITANKNKNNFNKKINFLSPKNHKWNFSNRYLKSLICIKLLLFYFLKSKKKFIILSFNNNLSAIIISKLIGAKIIVRSNTSISSYLNNYLKKILFKFFLKNCHKIIVNSKSMKKEFKRNLGLNSTCIYNPLENFKTLIQKSNKKIKFNFFKKDTINILNIGRLVEQKDQLTLINSLKQINDKIKFRALIIGEGEEKNKLNQEIKKNKLTDKVKMIGYQNNIYPYIKKTDIFVLTSKYEGLPNVIIECLAFKKIIISTNCHTGPSEILSNGKFGKLIKVGDYKNLALIIRDIKKNPNYYKKLANNGFKTISRFDYKINCEKYFKEIKKFL